MAHKSTTTSATFTAIISLFTTNHHQHQHPSITIKVPMPSYTNNIAEAKHLHNIYKMHMVTGITRSDLAYYYNLTKVRSNYLMVKTSYIQKNAILAETDWQKCVDVTHRINT